MKELSIEITNKCMNRCIFCSNSCNEKCNIFLDTEVIKKTIDEACSIGVRYLYISGGEPLLHKDIVEICKFSSNLKLKPIIYTSGIYYNNDSIPISLLSDIMPYISKLIFDIPSWNPLIYYNNTRNNVLSKVFRSINTAYEAGIPIEQNTIVTKLTLNSILNINYNGLPYSYYHIDKINLLRLFSHGEATKHYEILNLNEEDIEKIKNLDNDIFRKGIPLNEKKKCVAGYDKAVINYNGYGFPCDTFKNRFNIHDENYNIINPMNIKNYSLKECIEGDYFKIIRKRVSEYNKYNKKESCYSQRNILNIKDNI